MIDWLRYQTKGQLVRLSVVLVTSVFFVALVAFALR